ncbi:MAG: fatty acyl-AMP ligase [Deltaproteobacteria bacterium]|nr:fatty acyl-AMP ligase [Deltaproteobacteria bacterium]
MAETLIDVLLDASNVTHKGYTFLDDAMSAEEWSFADLAQEADRRAAYFRSLGLKQGDRLGMIVPDGKDFVLSFFGAVRAGIVPVPMYPPLALGKLDSYVDTATRILSTAGAKMLLTNKQVSPILWSLLSRVKGLEDIILTEKVANHDASKVKQDLSDVRITGEDTCFLQFTSGSTSDPKGVLVSHANLVANSKAIMFDGLKSDSETDIGVSWLPLYHDMGLIGFVIAPMLAHVPVVFLPTLSFVKRPTSWMEAVNKYRGTITFAPNFAFGLAAKRMSPSRLEGMDLSCLRVVGCGAEPINPNTMRNFVGTFEGVGLNPNAIMPCYGMAEATLAIAFDDLSSPFKTVTIDRDAYEEQHLATRYDGDDPARALELVACGATFSAHEVGIMDDHGVLLKNGKVGEIVFRGPSITSGYFDNADASKELLAGGWLHTGDLGFVLDGQLFISGRKKDLIILNGRNYYPQSIEWEVEHVEGIRRGNVVAFSTRGDNTEELVIVAETKVEEGLDELAHQIKMRVHDVLGVRARDVVLVGPGGLPKTSSGKLQRRRTKAQYEAGELGRENRTMGSAATKVKLAKHFTASAVARIKHGIKKGSAPARRIASRVLRPESR